MTPGRTMELILLDTATYNLLHMQVYMPVFKKVSKNLRKYEKIKH